MCLEMKNQEECGSPGVGGWLGRERGDYKLEREIDILVWKERGNMLTWEERVREMCQRGEME